MMFPAGFYLKVITGCYLKINLRNSKNLFLQYFTFEKQFFNFKNINYES